MRWFDSWMMKLMLILILILTCKVEVEVGNGHEHGICIEGQRHNDKFSLSTTRWHSATKFVVDYR
jgi:hypothetical protein